MPPGDGDPAPTSTYGEAVEQAARGMSLWYEEVAALVQDDVNLAAAGEYRVGHFASAGLRLIQVNVRQLIAMAKVASDNLALLAPDNPPLEAAPSREVTVVATLAAGGAGSFKVSSLTGLRTGRLIPTWRLSVTPPDFAAEPRPRDVEVTVAVTTGGLTPDTYRGELSAVVGATTVASRRFIVAIDELI